MNLKQNAMQKALELYQEKPWDLFDDHEVFELEGIDYGRAYCIFHEKHEKKCLTVFEGPEAFTDLSNHFKPMGLAVLDAFQYLERECFEILFDVPEVLEEEDKKLGNELGLSPRQIPMIWYYEHRCYPEGPNDYELERLILILLNLKDAMSAYLKSGMDLDFHKRRFVYHVKKKTCSSKRTGYRPRKYDIVEIDDPVLMDELQEHDRIDEVWEFDLAPTQLSLTEERNGRIQPVYIAALASVLNQQILSAVPFVVKSDFQFQCIDLMVEALFQRGIPQAVAVRHPLVGSALMDLCRKLNIELIPIERFEVLDDFYEGFESFMEQEVKSC